MFAVNLDGRYIYAGGSWDNSLKVISVSRGKCVASITKHLDIITCVALDNCGSYIVTGSIDCTCIVWSLNNNGSSSASSSTAAVSPSHSAHHLIGHSQTNTNNSMTPRPINTLYGHTKPVTCAAIFTELDMVVSGSEVNIDIHFWFDSVIDAVDQQTVLFSFVIQGWHSECSYDHRWSVHSHVEAVRLYRRFYTNHIHHIVVPR